MAYRLFGTKQLLRPMMTFYQFVNWTCNYKPQWNFNEMIKVFIQQIHLKWSSAKWQPFCLGLSLNILTPRRNRQHFTDDIFKRIFLNENVWISIKISLKFVPRGPINNIQALVQIMDWRHPSDKPLSEPMIHASLGPNELIAASLSRSGWGQFDMHQWPTSDDTVRHLTWYSNPVIIT